MKKILALIALPILCSPAFAAPVKNNLSMIAQPELASYYAQYKSKEHFSGIALSVSLPHHPTESYYIGTVSRLQSSPRVDKNSLFQIGSISKSFTAAVVLQLVAEGKLKLSDPVTKYLPQYKKWAHITIKQLLDMSSGLPNYSESPSWNYLETQNIKRVWHNSELIDFVYPKDELNPPIKQGYYYTNTGYLLASMIIEKLTQQSFKKSLKENILKPMKLSNTFYPLPGFNQINKKRLMHGYGYNQYDNPELLGRDMQLNNLTWAGAAGAIVATSSDIIQWVQALFINNKLLSQAQKNQLTQMVSLNTGKAISKTTADDPKGFALGVIQSYNKAIGRIWYYQGETLGFRALYMYVPCNKIILATTVNSATNGKNDHIHQLLQNVYMAILKRYPKYQCKS